MIERLGLSGAAVLLVTLAGCERAPETNSTASTEQAAAPAPAEGSVERQVATPVEAPKPAPIQQVAIQTQPGPQGSQVTLNKVAVTGDVLTVQVTYSGEKGWSSPPIDQVSVIDDATAQRIGVLKDNDGKWLASPINGKDLWVQLANSPVIVWFKFPAPAATSKTVSINIPEVAPFDGVTVTR